MSIDENIFEQVNPDGIEQQEFDVVSEHLAANGIDPDEKN